MPTVTDPGVAVRQLLAERLRIDHLVEVPRSGRGKWCVAALTSPDLRELADAAQLPEMTAWADRWADYIDE